MIHEVLRLCVNKHYTKPAHIPHFRAVLTFNGTDILQTVIQFSRRIHSSHVCFWSRPRTIVSLTVSRYFQGVKNDFRNAPVDPSFDDLPLSAHCTVVPPMLVQIVLSSGPTFLSSFRCRCLLSRVPKLSVRARPGVSRSSRQR